MKNIESVIEAKRENILSKHPEQHKLTMDIFQLVLDMFHEDFGAISQKSIRLKIIYNCIVSILEMSSEQNVKKNYIIDLLDMFLDKDIVLCLTQGIEKYKENYIMTIRTARAELYCSQWSDKDSTHWQRAINHFKTIK